ncbi:Scr1 family TA system antitoxin-like transcriptional regulator [Streptomyces sp. NPDC047046]|uniref:Scr1 family TA system antitoxin-like transcriptional regulator n=1 Tax=Streptomyces sp. NPDC047046 TaxID=3155378 RepID=UPI0033DA4CD0
MAEQPGERLHVGVRGEGGFRARGRHVEQRSTVAYTENSVSGHVIESPAWIGSLQRRYDAVRDQALSPAASQAFIRQLLEEPPYRATFRSLTREA